MGGQKEMSKALEGNIFKKDTEVDDKEGKESDTDKEEVLAGDMQSKDPSGTLGSAQGDQSSMDSRYIIKSISDLTNLVKNLTEKVTFIENKEQELNKSVNTTTIEILAKSYNKKIRSLERENEDLQKSTKTEIANLHKSLEEVKVDMGRPARTRETVSNFDTIQKGSNDPTEVNKRQPLFKSKEDVLERLEELRKSGKVSGDEVIAYNASTNLSKNALKRLQEPK